MAESTAAFPYETRLNLLHGPLELIDVKALADACAFKWFNQTLCQVNGSVVQANVSKKWATFSILAPRDRSVGWSVTWNAAR